jgi:hypothetical protein
VDIADNLPVDFNFVRLEAGQQRKPGIAGTKIIDRQANPLTAKLLDGAVKLVEPEIISFSVTSMTTCSG